jgi:transcriptional regulator with XRE-family HTH domain
VIKNKKVRQNLAWEKSKLPTASKFAERFCALLKEQNMSRASFGKKYGIPPNTVSNWCTGTNEPSFDMLIFICKEFQEPSDYLLGLTDV